MIESDLDYEFLHVKEINIEIESTRSIKFHLKFPLWKS